jgi:hypothetical protein
MSANTNRPKMNLSRTVNKTKGYMNKSVNYLKSTNKIVLGLVALFILFVLGIVVYFIYKAIVKSKKGDTENPILVSDSIDASDKKNAKSWFLPTSSGSTSPNMAFTISFWMYIVDWNYRYNYSKAILIKSNKKNNSVNHNNSAPGIWLAPRQNNLIVATKVMGSNKLQVCDVANIPIQKWVHVAYVLDNRTVDVYVDCKLERSCILTGVPSLNNGKLHLFPNGDDKDVGFLGQLSSLRYFSSALRPVDIARLCNEGPHATKGEQSKDEHKDDNDGECPQNISQDLHSIQKSLKSSLKEVTSAIEEQEDSEKNKNKFNYVNDYEIYTKFKPLIKVKTTKLKANDDEYQNNEHYDNSLLSNKRVSNEHDNLNPNFPYKLTDVKNNIYNTDVYCNKNVKSSDECFGPSNNYSNACYVDKENKVSPEFKKFFDRQHFYPCSHDSLKKN